MDFTHTEDRRMLADTIARFVRENYAFEARAEIVQSDAPFSRDRWSDFAELGLIGAQFEEQDGGFGGAGFDIAVVFEELGKGLVVEPFLATLLAGRTLVAAGNAEQKALLEAVISGETLLAFAHAEPQGRYGLSDIALRAEVDGGGYVLTGDKSVVFNGGAADQIVVLGRTSGNGADTDGLSLFLVDAQTAGLTRRAYKTIDGVGAAECRFDAVKVPSSALIGPKDKAYPIVEEIAGLGLLALSSEALGAMETAKTITLDYLQTRKQFGRPIGAFQALQHRMAEMLIEIEQMRSAVINAASALTSDRRSREMALSAAKYLTGKVGRLVAEDCIQLHGGIGMTWEYSLPHYSKRIVMIDHILGDEDHHLARYIALSKEAA
ncbi:MAG: acyl-CoA dehydrogenase [Pseudomonadota bacterium]